MRSVLNDRPWVHDSDPTVSISCVVDDPDADMFGFVVSKRPTYRFKLPRNEHLFDLSPHGAAKYLAEADARVGELIDEAVASGGAVKIARHRVQRDSMDRVSDEKVIDEWAYLLVSGRATVEDAERELRSVFVVSPDYSDPAYGGGDFMAMVQRFADDEFYKCHQLAKEFIRASVRIGRDAR